LRNKATLEPQKTQAKLFILASQAGITQKVKAAMWEESLVG